MKTITDNHIVSANRDLRFLFAAALVAAFALGAAACGDDAHDHEHDHDATELDPHEEACEHMAEAAGAEVTAVAYGESGAPDVTVEHARVEITFVEVEGGMGGDVTFVADEDNEFFFFLSANVPFGIFDAAGGEVALEASEAVSECSDVAVGNTFDLGVGTYTLSFGPTEETSVGLVFEEAGAHVHEE